MNHEARTTNATRIEAYRRGLEAIRRGAGQALLMGCNHPLWPSLGLIHASRSSLDIERSWPSFTSIGRFGDYLYAEFYRALDTCDTFDVPIKSGTTRVLWAQRGTLPDPTFGPKAEHIGQVVTGICEECHSALLKELTSKPAG